MVTHKTCIFDIDGTLFDSNSTFDFFEYFFSTTKNYRILKFILGNKLAKIINRVLFRIFSLDLKRMLYIAMLRNKSYSELSFYAKAFCYDFLSYKKKKETFALLKELRTENIYFVTATMDFLAEQIVAYIREELSLENISVGSTKLAYNNNICTGKIEMDLLGKKLYYLFSLGLKRTFDIVVSDDLSDLELMKNSKMSYVVFTKKNYSKWNRMLKKQIFAHKIIET